MEWYYIILIIVLFLIINQLVASYIPFCFIFKRDSKQEIPYTKLDLANSKHKDYEELIRSSFAFFENMNFKEEEMTSFDNLTLKAKFYDNNSETIILFAHGYRSTPLNSFACVGKTLYEQGFSAFFIHQRAHGDSEGNYTTFGIKERKDIKSWCEYINNKYNPKNIILYGSSMGCASIEMAMGLNLPDNVRCCILDCGFDDVYKLMLHEVRKRIKINVRMSVFVLNIYTKLFAKFSLKETTSSSSIKGANIPCFFITGKADEIVDFSHVENNYNACSAYKEACFLDDVRHGMCYYKAYPYLENNIINFINMFI